MIWLFMLTILDLSTSLNSGIILDYWTFLNLGIFILRPICRWCVTWRKRQWHSEHFITMIWLFILTVFDFSLSSTRGPNVAVFFCVVVDELPAETMDKNKCWPLYHYIIPMFTSLDLGTFLDSSTSLNWSTCFNSRTWCYCFVLCYWWVTCRNNGQD